MLTPVGPRDTVPPRMGGPQQRLLAIDIGTSSVKAGLVSSDGRLLASHRRTIPESSIGVDDWTATIWEAALVDAIGGLQRDSGVAEGFDKDLAGIAVSGNGPTVVAVGADGEALAPVLLWFDRRGRRLDGTSSFFLPKISWLREHHPDVYDTARFFFSCPEYFAFRLTGCAVTITPHDAFEPHIWKDPEIESYAVDRWKLPPFVSMADRIGVTTKAASEQYGLPCGVPVFASGSDFLASLIGTATVRPGRTCDRAGTSEGINHCFDRPVHDARLRCLPHAVEGLYNVAGILASTGRIFEWFRGISGQQNASYDEMLQAILGVGLEHRVPWFFPSIHQGAAWEFSRGMFIDLGAEHGAPEMGRAVVESIGYAVRESIEILVQSGCDIEELRACGGQAKNDIWNQMKADMIGTPIMVSEVEDAEFLGSAACCLVGLGEYAGIVDAADHLVRRGRLFEPDPERFAVFGEKYHRYQEAYGRFRRALSECGAL